MMIRNKKISVFVLNDIDEFKYMQDHSHPNIRYNFQLSKEPDSITFSTKNLSSLDSKKKCLKLNYVVNDQTNEGFYIEEWVKI